MSEIIAGAIGFTIGYLARSANTARNRLRDDIAFIRSLPEPPSHCRLIDDDTDGLTVD